jgi:hypothetical protein
MPHEQQLEYSTRQEDEIAPIILKKLPNLEFCTIHGGDRFLRNNIEGSDEEIKSVEFLNIGKGMTYKIK